MAYAKSAPLLVTKKRTGALALKTMMLESPGRRLYLKKLALQKHPCTKEELIRLAAEVTRK